ncbi:hypothetical protein Tco_0903604 [Tanacetum coccineum]
MSSQGMKNSVVGIYLASSINQRRDIRNSEPSKSIMLCVRGTIPQDKRKGFPGAPDYDLRMYPWKSKTNVEGAKSDKDATYKEDQGNEHVEDTNTNLDGRDDVMSDVILPQSSSVSSGFVSNMLNPNQDTGVEDIFGQHVEATSLIDTPVTAIVEPSFSVPTNRPPTPNPLILQIQQPPIQTTGSNTSPPLQNLPNFACCMALHYRLSVRRQLSGLDKRNQYAEHLLHSWHR